MQEKETVKKREEDEEKMRRRRKRRRRRRNKTSRGMTARTDRHYYLSVENEMTFRREKGEKV